MIGWTNWCTCGNMLDDMGGLGGIRGLGGIHVWTLKVKEISTFLK